MKSTTGWNAPNTGATNSSGFGGLPGGFRFYDGTFSIVGVDGLWWSAGEFNTTYPWSRSLYYGSADVFRLFFDKTNGFSVRVVKD